MSTYAQLKSDIAGWLERDDIDGAIPSFIRLCEQSNRRELRLMAMEQLKEDFTADARQALPTGFLEIRRIYRDTQTGSRELTHLTPNRLWASQAVNDTDSYSYTIEGTNIVFAPNGSTDIKMLYVKAFDELANDSDTNWLLQNAYDVYLYGSLMHSAPYLGDDQRGMMWLEAYNRCVADLYRSDKKSAWVGSPMIRQPASV